MCARSDCSMLAYRSRDYHRQYVREAVRDPWQAAATVECCSPPAIRASIGHGFWATRLRMTVVGRTHGQRAHLQRHYRQPYGRHEWRGRKPLPGLNLFYGNGVDVQGAVSGGAYSLRGDPAFVDPLNGDFHLSPTSRAIEAGTDAGITRDFDGDVRPQGGGYDVGFDEFIQEPEAPTPSEYSTYLPIIRR